MFFVLFSLKNVAHPHVPVHCTDNSLITKYFFFLFYRSYKREGALAKARKQHDQCGLPTSSISSSPATPTCLTPWLVCLSATSHMDMCQVPYGSLERGRNAWTPGKSLRDAQPWSWPLLNGSALVWDILCAAGGISRGAELRDFRVSRHTALTLWVTW